MKGAFTCPYCNTENACDCDTCYRYIKQGEYVNKWTEDGEAHICGKCGKVYSPDQSLYAEFSNRKNKQMKKETKSAKRSEDAPISKLAKIVKGKIESFNDGSASWVRLDTREVAVDFIFDGKGQVLENILVSEKKYHEVVEEKIKHKIEINKL